MLFRSAELRNGNSASTPLNTQASAPVASAISQGTTETPKVQAPKPIDIKVDVQALKAKLLESIEKLNQTMRDGGRNLNFHMDESIGGPVVLVKNAETGEVVRQIPNEVVVRFAHSIDNFKGLLHNKLT